jgi:hypothetical protein
VQSLLLIINLIINAGETMAQIVDTITPVTDISQIQSSEVDALFNKHLKRLGFDTPEAREQLYKLGVNYGLLESSGIPTALNTPQKGKKASTAKGLYQFITGNANPGKDDSSLQVAVNRTKRTINAPWLDEVFKSGNVQDLTPAKQTVLLFGDLLEKKGSDKFLKEILDPSKSPAEKREAERNMYLKLHHTNPDPKTLINLDSKLPSLSNVVNTSTSFMFDPTPENQQQISTSDRPYPQTQIMTHRQQNLDLNRDQFQFMSREGRDRKILEDHDLTYEDYVAAINRRQGRK